MTETTLLGLPQGCSKVYVMRILSDEAVLLDVFILVEKIEEPAQIVNVEYSCTGPVKSVQSSASIVFYF